MASSLDAVLFLFSSRERHAGVLVFAVMNICNGWRESYVRKGMQGLVISLGGLPRSLHLPTSSFTKASAMSELSQKRDGAKPKPGQIIGAINTWWVLSTIHAYVEIGMVQGPFWCASGLFLLDHPCPARRGAMQGKANT